MSFRTKPLMSIVEADIMSLIGDGIAESHSLEYKRDLYGNAERDHAEFLADVTAMANTDGGRIVIGVACVRDHNGQETGIPASISALTNYNADAQALRFRGMLQAVAPPLANAIEFREIATSGGSVLIIDIPRSLARPHMVTYKGKNRFYRRSANGKYPATVTEIRSMFLEGQQWFEDAEAFHRRRRDDLIAQSVHHPFCLIHLLPLGRMRGIVDLRPHTERLATLAPPHSFGWSPGFNSKGHRTTRWNEEHTIVEAYSQVLRFGGLEAFTADYTATRNDVGYVYVHELELWIAEYLENGVALLDSVLEITAPFALCVTLLGLKGYSVPSHGSGWHPRAVDEHVLQLPTALIESVAQIRAELAALFQIVWQSAGYSDNPRRAEP